MRMEIKRNMSINDIDCQTDVRLASINNVQV